MSKTLNDTRETGMVLASLMEAGCIESAKLSVSYQRDDGSDQRIGSVSCQPKDDSDELELTVSLHGEQLGVEDRLALFMLTDILHTQLGATAGQLYARLQAQWDGDDDDE